MNWKTINMHTVIFVGPTLGGDYAFLDFSVEWRPPVSFGDIFKAVVAGAKIIGVIDGYFEHVPAVWHKEILWAIHQGCHVYGSASMGALRAAELDAFGMRGIGRIYEAFRDGILSDDDEVAVRHAPSTLNYMPLSDAMVNIRFTMRHAVNQRIIASHSAQIIENKSKNRFYGDRSFKKGIEDSSEEISPDEIKRLKAWLTVEKIDQKKLDAYKMLKTMKQDISDGLEPLAPSFNFAYSSAWVSAMFKLDPIYASKIILGRN